MKLYRRVSARDALDTWARSLGSLVSCDSCGAFMFVPAKHAWPTQCAECGASIVDRSRVTSHGAALLNGPPEGENP